MLKLTIAALVALTIGTLAYANHENMKDVGDEATDIGFNAGLTMCATLDDLKNGISGKPARCGQTSLPLLGDVLIVEKWDHKRKTYILVQVTVKAQMIAQGVTMPVPPQNHFVVWDIEDNGEPV